MRQSDPVSLESEESLPRMAASGCRAVSRQDQPGVGVDIDLTQQFRHWIKVGHSRADAQAQALDD